VGSLNEIKTRNELVIHTNKSKRYVFLLL